MKRLITMAAVLLLGAAACSQRYEVDLPLALNRTEMRFKSSGNSYYVLVYSDGHWTAELDKDVPWVTLSKTSGDGNGQIMVSTDINKGVSRGVTLIVSNGHGSREMYISQEKGTTDGGNYRFVKEGVELLRAASTARIMAGTDLDDATVEGAIDTVIYATENEDWVHDIEVSRSRVTFRVDENGTGADRTATVRITFPLARWDTPVTAYFNILQSVGEPVELQARVESVQGNAIHLSEDERLTLLDADGNATLPASVSDASAEGATLLLNGDAIRSGILGGVYPEDYVSRWSGGKVYVSIPAEQELKTSLSRAADLTVLAGKKEGESLVLRSACSILRIKIAGTGSLRELSVSSGLPLAGEGSIDMGAEAPFYTPSAGGPESISVLLPEGGINLPAELYLTVPSGHLGRLTVNATTSAWSGSVTAESETVGIVHDIVPLEEITLSIPAGAENLSEGGKWANCYLVEDPAEKLYCIDIRRPDGTVPAEDITRCSYLWQTAPDVLTYLAIDAKEGKLYFRKGQNRPGNAHVAVLNADGEIRWSYHIWAPATPVESRKFGSYSIMDRNLGAREAMATDFSGASIGMHFQWGRKDPFPPSAQTGTSGNGNHGKVYPDAIAFVTAQDGVPQELADATPTTYYWGSGASGKQDWREVQDDNLWASANSNNNPCPKGWTVSGNEVLSLIAARMTGITFESRVGITIKDDDNKPVLFAPGGVYRRSTSTASEMANMGDGWIWSATPVEDATYGGSYRLWYQSNMNNRRVDKAYPQRRWGGNVRCVKVQ